MILKKILMPLTILLSLGLGLILVPILAVADNQLDNGLTVVLPLKGMAAVIRTTQIELEKCNANLKVNETDVAVDSFSLVECLKNTDLDGDGHVQGRNNA